MKSSKITSGAAVILALVFQAHSGWAQDTNLIAIDAAQVPTCGTFWSWRSLSSGHLSPPLPMDPFLQYPDLPISVPVYQFPDGSFLMMDSDEAYAALEEQRQIDQALGSLERQLGLAPMEEETPSWPSYPSIDTNSFYLEISNVTDTATLVVHNAPDAIAEILSKESLTDPFWLSEGSVAITNVDATLAIISVGSRTNNFFWARSPASEDALPLDWQWQYFNHTGVDPNADPDADGYTNLQEYRNGTDPTAADQPFKVHITRPASNSVIP